MLRIESTPVVRMAMVLHLLAIMLVLMSVSFDVMLLQKVLWMMMANVLLVG